MINFLSLEKKNLVFLTPEVDPLIILPWSECRGPCHLLSWVGQSVGLVIHLFHWIMTLGLDICNMRRKNH